MAGLVPAIAVTSNSFLEQRPAQDGHLLSDM